jgi:hypothetical protein
VTDGRLTGRSRWLVAAVALTVGAGALFGGYGLLSDAEELGAKAEWLDGSPFHDYRIRGVVLLVVIGGGMLLTAMLALRRSRVSGLAALTMGLLLLIWGVVETASIGFRSAAQLLLLALFVVGPTVPLLKLGWDASGPTIIRGTTAR